MLAPHSSHQNSVMSETETESKPKLRWYQYSLRSLVLVMVSALVTVSSLNVTAEKIRSFPIAEGAGAFSVGGRGGKVLFVTNLNDAGPGSLRAALDARHPRIVVFRVGGAIELRTDLLTSRSPARPLPGMVSASRTGALVLRIPTMWSYGIYVFVRANRERKNLIRWASSIRTMSSLTTVRSVGGMTKSARWS